MSGQILELVVFAAIAFFVINKLISILGSTSEEDPTGKSRFGEPGTLRDVTSTAASKTASVLRPVFSKKSKIDLNGLIIEDHKSEIEAGLLDVADKMPNFNANNFLKASKTAFKMIIESGMNDNNELEELIDKRYLENFRSMAASYGEIDNDNSKLSALISEVYTFGNNIFIKVLFTGKNVTNKIKELHEEWTFTKSTLIASPEWHLTNIDRPQ